MKLIHLKDVLYQYPRIRDVDDMQIAIEAVRCVLRERLSGRLTSPPRHVVRIGAFGELVFTIGGTEDVAGFRVYDTFAARRASRLNLVAVWGPSSGSLYGIVIGAGIGPLRTGAIGAVAADLLASHRGKIELAVIGAGAQALAQLYGISCLRSLDRVRVAARTIESGQRFAAIAKQELNVSVKVSAYPRDAVEGADIVVCATNSTTPVIRAEWLKSGVHVNAVGLKTKLASEISIDLVESCEEIFTDSVEQARCPNYPLFLSGTSHLDRIKDISSLIEVQKEQRSNARLTRSLFLSVGLAGTEAVVMSRVLLGCRPVLNS